MIRPATAEDASRLAEIYIFAKRSAYRGIFKNDRVSFNELQVLPLALQLRDDPAQRQDLFVCDDGIVRGLMRWNRCQEAWGIWELKELYVDPFFQGGGYGRELMDSFLTSARAGGMHTAILWVLEKNDRARGFYARFGFAPDGGRKLQPDTPEYLLRYRLALGIDCQPNNK